MNTIEKLNALAEIDAQKTILSIQKQELLDAIKIPAEIQIIHDDGEKRLRDIDGQFLRAQETIENEKKILLSAVVIPPEILEAYRQIEERRNQIEEDARKKIEVARAFANSNKLKIDAEFNSKVSAVYADIDTRKREIESEFGEKVDAANDNAEKLIAEIKEEVKVAKKTVTGTYKQAVYVKGRITWNTDKMEAWIVDHPFLKDARKEGDPSVSIKNVG